MQYDLKIIPEEQLVIETITGEVTLEGMIEKTTALFAHPDYSPSFCGIVDLREAITRMSKVELLGFANLINESDQFGKTPWAVLGADPMVIALSQVFQQRIMNPDMIGVFSTVSEAARFLHKPAVFNFLED